jgi:uncharacterized protein (TIGR00288 family)
MPEKFRNIAVLIDAENISHNFLEDISENVALYGIVSVRRIYGDWTSEKMKGWRALLLEYAIQPIQQFSNTVGKNSTDSALIIDAMDLLYLQHFDCFCIVSSDSDFTRLASRIREQGKYVVGIGEKKTPSSFVNACNEFIHIEPANQARKEEKRSTEKLNKTEVLLEKAVDQLADSSGWVMLSQLMQYLRQVKPDFDLRELGVRKPLDYFTGRKEKYLVQKDREDAPSAVFISRSDGTNRRPAR